MSPTPRRRSAFRAPVYECPETERRRAALVCGRRAVRPRPRRAHGRGRGLRHVRRSKRPPGLSGERDDGAFPIRERLRFRDNLGLGLRELRQRGTFAALRRGPWQVFIAIACYWQANAEAWPSQETIATFTGYSSRAVRDYVEMLERVCIVRLRRERRPGGADRIYCSPGRVTLIELAAFVERFPRGPANVRIHIIDVGAPGSISRAEGGGHQAATRSSRWPTSRRTMRLKSDQAESGCASCSASTISLGPTARILRNRLPPGRCERAHTFWVES